MKHILYLLFVGIFFSGCSSYDTLLNWQNLKEKKNITTKLQTGDILIQIKEFDNPMSWFGHSSVVVKEGVIGDFSNLWSNYNEYRINDWVNSRKTIVLRYKGFDKAFKTIFQKNVQAHKNDSYLISLKEDETSFYCSKYIWHLYKETALALNYDLDLDSDRGALVFPYDFLTSNDLMMIEIGKQ